MRLELGVQEFLYADAGESETTGQVAEWLENKYHIMRSFFEIKEEQINEEIANFFAGLIESLAMGMPMQAAITRLQTGIFDKIERMFRDFLDAEEMNKILPTHMHSQAAKKGIRTRMKKKIREGVARAAFVDTGMYQASFRAWLEEAGPALFGIDE